MQRTAAAWLGALIGLCLLPACAEAAHAYVSNEDGNSVTIIDTAHDVVVATVPVGKRPRGLKLSHDGKLLFVAVSGLPKCPPTEPDSECAKLKHDFAADGIAVVDTAKRRLVRVLKAGSDPEQFDVSHDGRRLYISNEDAGTLSVLDVKTGALVATIPVGREPEGVRVSPNARWVLVTSETDSTVTIINAHTLHVVRTVHVGLRPRDVAYTPDSRGAYVPGEADSTVYYIHVPGGHPKKILQLSRLDRPMGVILDAARHRLYVSTGRGGTLAIVDVKGTPKLIKEIHVGKRPWGIALSRNGRYLYTANGPSNDVSVIDTAKEAVIRKIPAGRSPWGVVLGR